MMPLFLVVLAAGLLIAEPAHAGFFVPFVAGVLGGGAIATAAAHVIVSVGASLVSRAPRPKQKAAGPGAISLDAPTSGDGTPQTIILGRRPTPGHRTCPEYSRGDGLEWLTIVRDLSDMPVDRLVAVWIGNDRIAIPAEQGSAWFEPGGKYAGKVRIRFRDGTQTAADPHMLAQYGSHPDRPWTEDMALTGVAYAIVELHRDQELFPGIPDLLFEVRGARLLDPRTDNMVWSRNAALLAYNVMRGIELPDGSIYGGGIPAEDLPLANWASAISECEAAGWNADLEVNVGPEDYDGDAPYEVIEHLLQAAAGQVAESGGTWRIRIGGPGLPVATVTDPDVLVSEDQVFHPHEGPREIYNGITAQYAEPGERWEGKTTPLRLDAGYVARDGGRNVVHLTYAAVTDSEQVQKLAQMALDDNRRQRVHELSLPPDYAPVEPLDTLTLSLPYDGYVAKLVEVVAIYRDPVTLNQRAMVREVDPNDYTPPSVTPLPTQPVVTTPPPPQPLPGWAVEPVIVQDDQGRNRRPGVRIMWTPLPAEGIEWELRSAGATDLAGEGTTQAVERGRRVITAGVIGGAAMEIRARAVLRNRARAWTAWTAFAAPDVGTTWADFSGALREEIEGEFARAQAAEEAALEANEKADELRNDLTDATTELQGEIDAIEQLAMDNLLIAQNYTDTSVFNEAAIRQAANDAMAAQINILTAVINSENYLENPRFSSGLTGWAGNTGATTIIAKDDQSGDPLIANAPTNSFASITTHATSNRDLTQEFGVEWLENEMFQWRVYAGVNEAGRTARVMLHWLNSSGGQIRQDVTDLTLVEGQWRVFSGQHAPPAGAVELRFRFRVLPVASGQPVGFADASVTKVDQSAIARIADLEVVVANNEAAFTSHRNQALARFDANEATIATESATRANQFGSLSSQINTVSAAASRQRTFRNSTPPANPQSGDIWYDTSDNNRASRYGASGWQPVDDGRIAPLGASVTTQATAIAGIEGNLSAGYLLRAQAGNAVSLIDVIAADGSGPPQSIIKLEAEQILAKGSVGMEMLTMVDLSGNMIPDAEMVSPGVWVGNENWRLLAPQNFNWARGESAGEVQMIGGPGFRARDGVEFSILQGVEYSFSGKIRHIGFGSTTGVFHASIVVRWLDVAGEVISSPVVAVINTTTAAGPSFVEGSVSLVAPAGARRAVMRIQTLAANQVNCGFNSLTCVRKRRGSTLLEPGSVTSDLVTAFTMRALLGQFENLQAANISVGAAEIGTLNLAGNSVTVPASQTLANTLPGNGSWRQASQISYTLPMAGAVTIQWFATQGYDNLSRQSCGFRLLINGSVVHSVGGDGQSRLETDYLSFGQKRNLGAGTHNIVVQWYGANGSISLYSRTLIIDGAMR